MADDFRMDRPLPAPEDNLTTPELAALTPHTVDENNRPVITSFEDIPEAIVSGKVKLPENQRINVVDKDGQSFNVSSQHVPDLLTQGYALESPNASAVREYVNANKGLSGTLKVGLGQFADEALLGIPETAYDLQADPLDVAKKNALKADHEIANAAGGIAGFGASLYAAGGLFEGAAVAGEGASKLAGRALTTEAGRLAETKVAESLLAKGFTQEAAEQAAKPLAKVMLENAVKFGVENTVLEAPKVLTEASLGNPDEAAEHLAYAFGGGVLFGGVGAPLSKGLKNLNGLLSEAKTLQASEGSSGSVMDWLRNKAEEYSYKIQAKNAGALKSNVSKIGAEGVIDSSRLLSKEGYLNKGIQSKDQVAANIGQALSDGWSKMDNAISQLDARAPEIKALAAEEGQIGIVDKLEELKSKFKYAADEDKRGLIDDAISNFNQDAALVAASDTPLKELHNIRKSMDAKLSFNAMDVKPLTQLKEQIRNVYSSELNKFIENVSTKLEQPELATAWKDGNKLYSAGKDYQKFLTNEQNAFIGNRMFGLTDNIAGAAGLATTIAHGPAGLTIPVAKKALESSYGQTAIASLLYKFSKAGADDAGLLLAEQGMKKSAEQLDRIPAILKNSWNALPSHKAIIPLSAMSRFIGNHVHETTMEGRQKILQDLSAKVKSFNSNPTAASEQLGNLSAGLQIGAPKIAESYTIQMQKILQHIQEIIPQGVGQRATPFQKPKPVNISNIDLVNFERRLRVIENPYTVLDDIQSGAITQGQIDTLRAIYPNIYSQIQSKFTEAAQAHTDNPNNKQFSYSQRLKMSILLQQPLDPSLENVAAYQSTFDASNPDQNGGAGAAPSGKKLNIVSPKSNPYQTPTGRVMSK